MKSCDENQNLMSTLLPLKNCPCAAYSGIESFNTEGTVRGNTPNHPKPPLEEYLACFKHDKSNKS